MSARTKLAVPSFIELPLPAAEPVELSLAVPEPVADQQRPQAARGPSPRCDELSGFGARLLTDLPLATTLVCRRRLGNGQLVVTTSRAVYEAAKRNRVPVFAGSELWALVLAAEHERGSPVALEMWCAQKVADPAWRLTAEVALGEVCGTFLPRGWSLGMALRTFGAELVEVCLEDELPALLEQHAEAS